MNTNLKYKLLLGLLFVISLQVMAQRKAEKWKGQLSVGINNPIENDQSDYYSDYINVPTVNLGVQHMVSESLGAKLDLGFNRSSNNVNSPEFKLNYTRINLQVVYDFYELLRFLQDRRITVIGHAGPGMSFSNPLGDFKENKQTFLNALGGFELHYALSDTFSIYSDLGYVLSLSSKEKYNPAINGFSFNGDLIYLSFGMSFSLSGCHYC